MTGSGIVWWIAYYVVFLLYLFLIGRVVVEIVRGFARDWRPEGPTAVGLEMMFRVTDPPVKLLRRLIPTVRIGAVSLDLSMLVLLVVVTVAMFLLRQQALASLPAEPSGAGVVLG